MSCHNRRTRTTADGRNRGHLSFPVVVLLLAAIGTLHSAPQPNPRTPLFREAQIDFPGDVATRDFNFRLPASLEFRKPSELHLELRPSADALARLCMLEVWCNGRLLPNASVRAVNRDQPPGMALALQVDVPGPILRQGWNQVRVVFRLNRPQGPLPPAHAGRWIMKREGNYLSVAATALPVFPELQRFPDTYTESALLEPENRSPETSPAQVTLVLPPLHREIHLRACAILGARLGQSGILRPEQVAVVPSPDWRATRARHTIFVGTHHELTSLGFTPETLKKMAALSAGQGFLAEQVVTSSSGPVRRLIVSGADDEGLLRALRTLSSSPALATAPPNPAVLNLDPAAPTNTAPPSSGSFSFAELGAPSLRLAGVGLTEATVSGWRLPASRQLSGSSRLQLRFQASGEVVTDTSLLEVLVNGQPIQATTLSRGGLEIDTWDLALPPELPGRDPMLINVRAILDPGPRACNDAQPDPTLTISGDSTLEFHSEPARFDNLGQVVRWITRDSTLTTLTFVLPDAPDPATLEWFTRLNLRLGSLLPSSQVLCPDVALYAPDAPIDPRRMAGRSVLLLGRVSDWNQALAPDVWLPVRSDASRPGLVRMQGRLEKQDSFEPTAVLLQMVRSPWSKDDRLTVAGGWNEFATPLLEQMLTDANLATALFGNVCAIDPLGRIAGYDTRVPNSVAFAELLRDKLPAGLSLEATAARQATQAARLRHISGLNHVIAGTTSGLLTLLVSSRLVLMWQRRRAAKRARASESPLDISP